MNPNEIVGRWDDMAEKVTTPCGDGDMVWRVWGTGPAVLLVHGGAGAWTHWIRNLEPLTAHYRVIAPDLPGLGESASPPEPYSPESIATIVADGLRATWDTLVGRPWAESTDLATRGSEGLGICGFSFGGMICGLVAERVAAGVRGITLIGASGLGGRFDDLAPVLRLPTEADDETLREVHRANLQTMMLHAPEAIDELAVLVQGINAPRTRVMSPKDALTMKLAEALTRTGLPVHSIWGSECIFKPDLLRRRDLLAEIYPAGEFHLIQGAGHWAQYESADEINPLLVKLLMPHAS